MTVANLENIAVGSALPKLDKPAINRTTLGLFAGASGDHNPIHIDLDFAKKAGMLDVFAHGMLSMAYLAQLLTNWVPQASIKSYGVRFGSITHLGDEISCQGQVKEIFEENGEQLARLELAATNQNGDVKLAGTAVVAIA